MLFHAVWISFWISEKIMFFVCLFFNNCSIWRWSKMLKCRILFTSDGTGGYTYWLPELSLKRFFFFFYINSCPIKEFNTTTWFILLLIGISVIFGGCCLKWGGSTPLYPGWLNAHQQGYCCTLSKSSTPHRELKLILGPHVTFLSTVQTRLNYMLLNWLLLIYIIL